MAKTKRAEKPWKHKKPAWTSIVPGRKVVRKEKTMIPAADLVTEKPILAQPASESEIPRRWPCCAHQHVSPCGEGILPRPS